MVSILHAIGSESKPLAVASSASLATLSFFYVYLASTFAKILIFPLVNRVTYYSVFDLYVAGETMDKVIIVSLLVLWLGSSVKNRWPRVAALVVPSILLLVSVVIENSDLSRYLALSSLPAILVLLLMDRIFKKDFISWKPTLAVNHILIVSLVVAGASILLQSIFLAFPSETPIGRNYLYDVFLVLSSFSPLLILLTIAYYPLSYLADYAKRKLRVISAPMISEVLPLKLKFIFLSLTIALSVILAVIPHLPDINVSGQNVGVDTGFYINWVSALLKAGDLNIFVQEAFVEQASGSRPLTLILIYAIASITEYDLRGLIEALPLVLAPALSIVTFFLAKELTSNEKIGVIASFIAAVSFQTLIGIYAGFYANWIAIIFGYLAIILLLRILRKPTDLKLILFSILIFLLLFSHVYTWTITLLAIGIFLAVSWFKHNQERRTILILFAIIFSSVAVDIARVVFTGSSGGIEGNIEIAQAMTGPEQFARRWNNLEYTVTTFVGGIFSNFIILGLAVYWSFESRNAGVAGRFLPIFLTLGILPFLFGDWVVQTRVYYDIPFQIPAAIGLYQIRDRLRNNLVLVSVCVWLVFIAVRTVSNFHLVLPQ